MSTNIFVTSLGIVGSNLLSFLCFDDKLSCFESVKECKVNIISDGYVLNIPKYACKLHFDRLARLSRFLKFAFDGFYYEQLELIMTLPYHKQIRSLKKWLTLTIM